MSGGFGAWKGLEHFAIGLEKEFGRVWSLWTLRTPLLLEVAVSRIWVGGQAGRVGKLSHKRLNIEKLEMLSFLGDSGPFSGGLENSRLDFCIIKCDHQRLNLNEEI